MGWFSNALSSIGSAISSSVKVVGRTVGTIVETAGKITGQENWEKAGRALKDWCSDVGEFQSYDKETASAADTATINEILTLYSSNLKEQADKLEKDVLDEVRDYFEDVISNIEDSGIPVQTKQFRRAMTQTERKIKGQLKSHLAKRVSIDDQECLNILAMSPGNEKTNIMDTFGKKVLDEGLSQLSKHVEETVKEYNEELQLLLNQLLEQKEKNLKQMQLQFEELLMQANGDLEKKEATKLKPAILLKSAEQLEKAVS